MSTLTRSVEQRELATLYTVEGPAGAVQLIVMHEEGARTLSVIGIHSRTQMYAEEPVPGTCDVLPEGQCFSGQTFLGAERAMERLHSGGEAAVFCELEEWYRSRWPGEEQ